MRVLVDVSLTLCTLTLAIAYPGGPPIDHVGFRSLCTDMNPKPGHTMEPQVNTPAPYKISLSHDIYDNDIKVQVNVSGKNGNQHFSGFMLQARRPNRKMPIGTFSDFSKGTKGLNCNPGNDTTWGHSEGGHKQVSSALWTAPKWDNGEVQFVATIVQGPNIVYWMDVKSDVIAYTGSSRPPTTISSGQKMVRYSTCSLMLPTIIITIAALIYY